MPVNDPKRPRAPAKSGLNPLRKRASPFLVFLKRLRAAFHPDASCAIKSMNSTPKVCAIQTPQEKTANIFERMRSTLGPRYLLELFQISTEMSVEKAAFPRNQPTNNCAW